MVGTDSATTYQQAYAMHYREGRPAEALSLYREIIERFPDSDEAGYARSQVANIEGEQDRLRAYVASLREAQSPQERVLSAEELEAQRIIREWEEPSVKVTTASMLHNYRVMDTHDIVTAECAFGMNLFRDMFAAWTDVFGGRSEATQQVLRDARRTCLLELKREALRLGANAVIGVHLDYQELGAQGKSMLLLVASGTAVTVTPELRTAEPVALD